MHDITKWLTDAALRVAIVLIVHGISVPEALAQTDLPHPSDALPDVNLAANDAKSATVAGGDAELPAYEAPEGESSADGPWTNIRNFDGQIALRPIQLVARPEPMPAMSVQLLPNAFELKDGNAAVMYLQAIGFLEQWPALEAMRAFERKQSQAAKEAGEENFAPHAWRDLRPEQLPLDEVKEYLKLSSFQPPYLKMAVKQRNCDFNRFVRELESPAEYLLPEIQALRGLARNQSLRFLVAMADGKTDQAVDIFGQQLAMATHLSQDPFLVSSLVGISIAESGWRDAFYLCEHPDAPNLYWAIAALPQPLCDMRYSLAYERELFFEQIKVMREVDTTPRGPQYWRRFVEHFRQSMIQSGLGDNQRHVFSNTASVTLMIAAAVPEARSYLNEFEGMSVQDLDTLPNTQVYFLAVRRLYENVRDEMFKWQFIPRHQRNTVDSPEDRIWQKIEKYDLITLPMDTFLPAVHAAMNARDRLQHDLALLQTVESIRHHMAHHNNQLPDRLADLELAAPHDPVTGNPFYYLRHAQGATLRGSQFRGYQVQLELRTAK